MHIYACMYVYVCVYINITLVFKSRKIFLFLHIINNIFKVKISNISLQILQNRRQIYFLFIGRMNES